MTTDISILGCGWLGLPLGRALVRQGMTVYGSTTRPQRLHALQQAGVTPVVLTLSAPDDAGSSDAALDVSDPHFFDSKVLVVTLPPRRCENGGKRYPDRIAALVRHLSGSQVRKVIFTSSTSVYAGASGTVGENDVAPGTGSGEAVLAAEALLSSAPFACTILRLGGLIGPDRCPGRFLAGKRDVRGGEWPVNLVHRDDCIRVITHILQHGPWDTIFNVVADAHPLRRDYYTNAAKALDLPPPTFRADGTSRGGKIVSNARLKHALPYEFLHPDPTQCLHG